MALPLASPFAPSLRASITTVRCSLAVSNAFSLSRSFSLASSFSGSTLGGLSFIPNKPTLVIERKRPLTIVAGKKYSLGQTKRNRSKKSLARVHGFRIRMRTTSGRKLLKRRRDKGRKVLCPKTHASSGKKHMGYGRRSKRRR